MLIKEIDIKALEHNAKVIKSYAKKRQVCAVVKANAYGFSIEPVVLHLNNFVNLFAVASASEAEKISDLTDKQILILTPAEKVVNFKNVSYTVSSLTEIKSLEQIALEQNRILGIHIKIDSGMGRLGIKDKIDFIIAVSYIKNSKNLNLKGVFTHFASCDKVNLKKQNKKFREFLKLVKLPKKCLIHSSSSYALFSGFKTAGNAVRCGLAFYGGINKFGLKCIFKAYAHVVEVKKMPVHTSIGYNGTFVTNKNLKVAVVNCGYFDGINRLLSSNSKTKNYFYIENKPCKILGRISMNLISIDVTNVNVKVGDRAYFIRNTRDLNKIAKNSQTINYEVLTSLNNCESIWL